MSSAERVPRTSAAPRRCPSCSEPMPDDAAFCEACGTRLGAPPVAAPSRPAAAPEFADFWTRLAAYILDSVIVGVCLPILALYLGYALASRVDGTTLVAWAGFIMLGGPPAYFWIGNSLGGTIGKRMVGLAVIDETGAPPGLVRGLIRYVVSLASLLLFGLGYLWMIGDPETHMARHGRGHLCGAPPRSYSSEWMKPARSDRPVGDVSG
jgi:uncharacterized RDD family membrane protein YckC